MGETVDGYTDYQNGRNDHSGIITGASPVGETADGYSYVISAPPTSLAYSDAFFFCEWMASRVLTLELLSEGLAHSCEVLFNFLKKLSFMERKST